ncbi:MAG: protein translocase subunit SecD [Actinomycetota bacterium]
MRRPFKARLAIIVLLALASIGSVFVTGASPRLGLDLEGGLSVILTASSPDGVEGDVLERTVGIIRDRINSIGVAESDVSIAGSNNILIQLPGVKDQEQALEIIGTTAQLTFRQVKSIIPATRENRPDITEDRSQEVNDQEVVYPSADEGEEGVLYRLEPARLTGDIVTRAEAVVDAQSGANWSVSIDMDSDGSRKWADFTDELACLRDEGEQIKSQVAIVLDGEVQSAAGMQAPGGGGQGVECGVGITGGQTSISIGDEKGAKNLALVLRTGALPLTLEQSEVRSVSPTLGRDSLQAGVLAGAIGLGLVMLYVLLYYRALGLVVWLGLLVFTALFYSLLSFLGETVGLALTLAGVAGVIVSIGITTDSYIVAFERLKDEVRTGKSLRAAVDKGMERAFKTILVADFVTGSAAVILFYLAVGPVKGFALTLGLATLIDVIVAFFFTRSIVNLLARNRRFSEGRFIGMKQALGVRS